VIANPPFSLERWGEEIRVSDPFGRNFAGVPPRKSGDYAWVQHMVRSMHADTGRMAVVLPHGALFRMGVEGQIRWRILEMDLLGAVIGLGPKVFSFAAEGKTFRFGSIRMPLEIWAPWRASEDERLSGLAEVETAVRGLLNPAVVLDILQNFTVFATDKKHRKIKIICRYQQYHTTNQLVERVV
jgi:hypothetical protein